MNAPNSPEERKEAKRRQQELRRIQKEIHSLLRAAARQKDWEVKRRILNHILLLDSTNSPARDMLLELDQAELHRYKSMGRPYPKGTTSTLAPASLDALQDPQE